MLRLILVTGISLVAVTLNARADKLEYTPGQIVGQIRGEIDSNLYNLPFRKDGKYAVRMYRTTGDSRYLNSVLHELYVAADRLHQLTQGVYQADYRAERLRQELCTSSVLGEHRVCQMLRRETVDKFRDHIFYTSLLLPELNLVNEVGMQLKQGHEKLLQTLSAFDFKPGFTDDNMIRAWASQQGYQLYWLKNFGAGDYRTVFTQAFKMVFPDSKDSLLSDQQYMTKIACMAHLVIAASGDFQEPVIDHDLDWVIDYFKDHIDEIIQRVETVISIEVGISLLLMGKHMSLVEKTRHVVLSAYNPVHRVVKPLDSSVDFNRGVNRNTLAIILLGWKNQYHPGPYLHKIRETMDKLPSVIEPEKEK